LMTRSRSPALGARTPCSGGGERGAAGRGGRARRKLEGREGEDGAAVAGGARGVVEDLADAGLAGARR
jgi:hypothetical protein